MQASHLQNASDLHVTESSIASFQDHPTVQAVQRRQSLPLIELPKVAELRELALQAGADDVGFVSLNRPELDNQRADILKAFPIAKALMAIVCRMNREPVRSVNRSAANLEFHSTTEHVNEVTREIVRKLEDRGLRAMNPSSGFPMEMSTFPGKIWIVSHKPVAVAAGLGQMGIHRNVIHPKFGNFIILGTVLLGFEIDQESRPINYNPCLSCKLCVAACPVGAIKPDGAFDPSACLTHNYREFMSGFTDWVDTVVDSPNSLAYRKKVSDSETASMWQSLSFGANYKAAYCLSVCPAGEYVIGPFLDNRRAFIEEQLKPLQKKEETIYVVANSDAEAYVERKFPNKKPKRVNGVRPTSITGFLSSMHIVFQPGQSKGLNAVYHFTFTGAEPATATVTIRDQKLQVQDNHVGIADCAITADSATWLGFLRKEKSIVWAIVRRKVRIKGKFALLPAFGKCFPS
jgi:NAD-dependent dihydropyrimidine dehydrogenase PreA subunit